MNIIVQYQPSAKELANVSALFIEKKPLLFLTIGLLNIVTSLFLLIFIIKLFFFGLTLQEAMTAFVFALWFFGHKPFHRWLLYTRMKSSAVINKLLCIEISRNGIIWSGKGLRAGNTRWEDIKYLIEANNGFILPNSFNKFLWLPLRGFQKDNSLQLFRELIKEKNISIKNYPRWVC